MNLEELLVVIIIGGIAGWLASTLIKGRGMGIPMNVLVGILGAFVGAHLLPILGIQIGGGLLGTILSPTIGAIVILVLVRFLSR